MNTTANDNATLNGSRLKNKGFALLDDIFRENQWLLTKNELNWINYTKPTDETTSFDIKISPNKIIVSVPIKNSSYQYVTTFNTYFDASEYIEEKLLDYIK